MKKIGLYLAVAVAALFVVKSLTQRSRVRPASPAEPAKPVAAMPQQTKLTKPAAVKPQANPTLAAKDPQSTRPSILQAFKTHGDNIVFSIQTEDVGCSLGDFNMMAADASMRGSRKVLVTVEVLGNKEARPLLSEQVPLNDFVKGREWVVPVTGKQKEAPLGVFICSDKSAANRCLGKSVKDINELWGSYQSASAGKGTYPADDHVLMFQYLHRQGEGVRFLPADALHHFGAADVRSILVALNGSGSDGQRIVQDVYRYLDVLKPMPGRLKRDAILFPLPNATCR